MAAAPFALLFACLACVGCGRRVQIFNEREQRKQFPEDILSPSNDLTALLLASRLPEAGFRPSLGSVPSGMPRSTAPLMMATGVEPKEDSGRTMTEEEREEVRNYFRNALKEAASTVQKRQKSGIYDLDPDFKPGLQTPQQQRDKEAFMRATTKQFVENEAAKVRQRQKEMEANQDRFKSEFTKLQELVDLSVIEGPAAVQETGPPPEKSLQWKDTLVQYILLIMALEGLANVVQIGLKLWVGKGGDIIDLFSSFLFAAVTGVLFKRRETANKEKQNQDLMNMEEWTRNNS
mmetsp:Transcript_3205/g.5159  ORF Transcript_3205/g.5159 Transcript_3205/m.5159 type:complete len:291 (-) Transcript_3205:88-960(-)